MILNSPRWDCRKSQVDGQLGGLDIIRKRERVAEAGVCHVYRGLSRASADRDGKSLQRSKVESPEEVDQVMVTGLEEYTWVVGGLSVKAKARGRAKRIALCDGEVNFRRFAVKEDSL